MTAETKHTPGPWKAVRASHGVIDILDSQQRDIVTIFGDWDEKRANARLIAASPDLLDALIEFFTSGDFDIVPTGNEDAMQAWMEKARNAIAKAEGRS